MKLSKILLLTDFSNLSPSLLKYGFNLASHLQAELIMQYVYYIPPDFAGEVAIPVDALKEYEQSCYQKFNQLKVKFPGIETMKVRFVLQSGDLLTEMNRLIDKEQIDLVVMGNHGGDFLTNILGSNTIKVIQHAHCPVLSVPETSAFEAFRRIGMAIDLKETSEDVLASVAALAISFASRVDIVHVSQSPVAVDIGHLSARLEHVFSDVKHEFYHVHTPDVEKGIEQHVENNNIDLLVLMPRKHAFFDRIFQKSVSRRLAYQHKVPLLTFHR